MFSIRRFVIYFLAAVALLLTYQQIQNSREPLISGQILEESQYVTIPDVVKGSHDLPVAAHTFAWESLSTRYPVTSTIQLPTGEATRIPAIQHNFRQETSQESTKRKQRQKAVRDTFERAWKSYRDKAWMHDELCPLTGEHNDKFGGWAASLVDNLDTLWIMGFKEEFEEAVQAAISIDLTTVKLDFINVFETTIRHLGGLISAYDLSGDERLLMKAIEFGHMLLKTFDTPNHIPVTRWSFANAMKNKPQEAGEQVLLAEIGSLTMEFTRLSQLTQDSRWFDAVHRITLLFADKMSDSRLPGMFPVTLGGSVFDVATDNWFTLNGMADSFYEYLPKMHMLLGGKEPIYEKLYSRTSTTALEHTLFRPMTPDNDDILFSGSIRVTSKGAELTPQGQHLGCFAGGMFAIGGKIFNEPAHVDIGRKLTEGCVWAYNTMPLGIMPELFTTVACKDRMSCRWNEKLWLDDIQSRIPSSDHSGIDEYIEKTRLVKGMTSYEDRHYHLRPEAIESVFIQYRITGNTSLLDVAEQMFNSIMEVTTTKLANAAMLDVTYTHEDLKYVLRTNQQYDSMESFWLAETLKYFYLIFSEPDLISLDEWVFNTEAHPFRRPIL